jgi:hypothetical protein
MADRISKMSFAEANAAIDEQRIVMIARLVRHCHRRCVGKLIAGAHDEVFECIFWN